MTINLKVEMLRLKQLSNSCKGGVKLLYYEHYSNRNSAISRNIELNNKSQEDLLKLAKSANPYDEDLAKMFT